MFNVKYDLCPKITSNIFIKGTNCCHNLCHRKDFKTSLMKCFYHGTERFRDFIRKLVPTNCPWKLFKIYVSGVGFIVSQ